MNIEDLQALVEKRRSTRGYDENRTVSVAMIRTILDCARWAPSGGNGQPWEFVVVREQSVRYKIADCYMKQMEQKREMDLAVRGTAKMTGDGFRHAPVHIVVLGDPRVKEAYPIRTKLEKAESHFITAWPMRRCSFIWRRRRWVWRRSMSATPIRRIWKRCSKFC